MKKSFRHFPDDRPSAFCLLLFVVSYFGKRLLGGLPTTGYVMHWISTALCSGSMEGSMLHTLLFLNGK